MFILRFSSFHSREGLLLLVAQQQLLLLQIQQILPKEPEGLRFSLLWHVLQMTKRCKIFKNDICLKDILGVVREAQLSTFYIQGENLLRGRGEPFR